MKILSIFVDESGDFGIYNSKFAPQYIFSMVFHEQEHNIQTEIAKLDRELMNLGYANHVVHTAPLIRKEEVYCNLLANDRRAIFTKLFYFAKNIEIRYRSFVFERKECQDEESLKKKIRVALVRFHDEHIEYFSAFDQVILYYDNGQKQLANILQEVMGEKLVSFYRKPNVSPYKYKLLQVADMLCTLKLLEIRADHNSLTTSELYVFHSKRALKKEFLKKIKKKEL